MLHLASCDGDRAGRAGDVRDRDAELAPTLGDSLHGVTDVLDASERVEEVVELLGVTEVYPHTGLGGDPVESHEGVRLGQRQIDVDERVAVSEIARPFIAVVEADRNLRMKVRRRRLADTEPGAQAAGDDGEQDIVDRRARGARSADRLHISKRSDQEGQLARRRDRAVERRARTGMAELAEDGPGHPPRVGEPRAHDTRSRTQAGSRSFLWIL